MFKRCACPVSLTCIHTQHQAMWRRLLAVETLPIDRWHIARTTGEDLRARSIAIEHETLPANRTRLLAAPVDLLPVLAVDLLACSRRRHCSPTRDGHQPVMTGHNARRPRTGRERRPWWWPSEASYLTVWTLNDWFFASLVHCMLRRLLSEYWRKETEKSKVFCGVVGLDGRCSAQAEQRKKPVAVGIWYLVFIIILSRWQQLANKRDIGKTLSWEWDVTKRGGGGGRWKVRTS